VKNLSTSGDLAYTGSGWAHVAVPTSLEERFAKRYSAVGNFTNAPFYNQIRDIILSEEMFSGIEFIFEVHGLGSYYVAPDLATDYKKYDTVMAEEENIRNYNVLSIKYKSSYGNLKVEIERQKPYITMDIIDAGTPGSNLLITLGATGINPPFQWSLGYTPSTTYNPLLFVPGTYSTQTGSIIPDTSGTEWIFDLTVKDSGGLTSNSGYYMVNAGNTYSFSGTFSYVSL